MGTIIHHVIDQSPLPSGLKLVVGKLNMSANYAAGGDGLDLSNYFADDAVLYLDINPSNSGYVFMHEGGNATNAKIQALVSGAATAVLGELNATTDLSALNVEFKCVGKMP